jgi:hypothetical protein
LAPVDADIETARVFGLAVADMEPDGKFGTVERRPEQPPDAIAHVFDEAQDLEFLRRRERGTGDAQTTVGAAHRRLGAQAGQPFADEIGFRWRG